MFDLNPVIDDLAALVAFPTISHRPVTGLVDFLAERYQGLGFAVERFDDPLEPGKTNLVATIGPQVPGGLCITGHMDVVPVDGQPWTGDPFVLRRSGGRLLGRGTADMKGFLASCLHALRALRPGDYRRPLTLVWTCDEEIGCHGSAHLVQAFQAAGRRLPAACLVGEPTGFAVLRQHAGHVSVQVEVRGQAAHSAHPELGANAVVAAARVVDALAAFAQELAGQGPRVPLNVARIHGGSAINIVPDRCVLDLGFRPPPGHDHRDVWRTLRARVEALRLPEGTHASVQLGRVTPSMRTAAHTPLERVLLPHVEPHPTAAAAYATDGGNLALLGAEPLICGPGRIEVAHQADEYVSEADLARAVRLVQTVVRAHCCAPPAA